jgi:DNA-binding FadR family transcriptional regulator
MLKDITSKFMGKPGISSEFFNYLTTHAQENPGEAQLPSLNQLSSRLNISVARLREQLEVAKALGLVEVRPRTGIKRLPYTFTQAVWQSLTYAIEIDPVLFEDFGDLRKQVELAYWREATRALTPADLADLSELVDQAVGKLRGNPIHVPHEEHRQFHLTIFCRLKNPFVIGILEAYWEAYEAVGLSLYTDLPYLEEVWDYHRKMVDSICVGDLDAGYQALSAHTDLLRYRYGYRDGES